jgi:hypothetical protein
MKVRKKMRQGHWSCCIGVLQQYACDAPRRPPVWQDLTRICWFELLKYKSSFWQINDFQKSKAEHAGITFIYFILGLVSFGITDDFCIFLSIFLSTEYHDDTGIFFLLIHSSHN